MRRRDREFFEREFGAIREILREQNLIANKREERLAKELRSYSEAMHRHFDDQARKTDDLLEESKAQRAALYAMMDRLGNGGAAAAG
jgi:hypothetical protein